MKKKPFLDDDSNATLNPNMKEYANPFPKKMADAVAFIEKHGLPPHVERTKKRHKPTLTALQTELMNAFAMNPTEKQMAELKDFLHQLFGEEYAQSEAKQEEMAA